MKKLSIAKIGKSFGVKGWNRFYPLTDFTSQFKKGASFTSDKIELEIEDVNLKQGIIKFKGFNTPEDAKKLTNRMLYSTEEETRKNVDLKEGEYFWFDIVGCEVVEKSDKVPSSKFQELKLGKVKEIERYNDIDYLLIFTDKELVDKGYPKRFLVDFKRVVKDVNLDKKIIETDGAFEILESLK